MEIVCSRSATVWPLGQHRSDTALFRKEFQVNLESWLHSCLFGSRLEKIESDVI
jgi:hypothetical protein